LARTQDGSTTYFVSSNGGEYQSYSTGPVDVELFPGVQYALTTDGFAAGPLGNITGSDGSVSFTTTLTAIPEPAGIGVLTTAALALLTRRRRPALLQ